MKWALAATATVILGMAVWASVTPAQVGRLPIEPRQQAYEVRLVNEMGYPIRLKMVRYGSGQYLDVDMPRNSSTIRQLYAGERVLCVWNQGRTLTLAAQVNVDTAGTLRIRPIAYPYAAAESAPVGGARRGQPKRAMEPLPRLKLEK